MSASNLTTSCGAGLWNQALQRLEREQSLSFDSTRDSRLTIINSILEIVKDKKEICLNKRWKFINKKGDTIVLRDICEKIIKWVTMFTGAVDVAAQVDPVHIGLPWAGIRILLQIAVNDVETFGAMLEGIEVVINLNTRSEILERIYVRDISPPDLQLEEALINLYTAILKYLHTAIRYYNHGTGARIGRSVLKPKTSEVQNQLDNMIRKQREVDPLLRLKDGENIRRISEQSLKTDTDVKDLSSKLSHLQGITDSNRIEISSGLSALNNKTNTMISGQDKFLVVLEQMNEPIMRVEAHMSKINTCWEDQENLTMLRWISRVQYELHHRNMIEDLIPHTGIWFRKSSEFIEWMNSSSSSVLWLHGIPGCGKTKLVSSVIQWIQDTISESETFVNAYFYCIRNPAEPERANPEEILRAILKQLLTSSGNKPALDKILEIYARKRFQANKTGSEPELLNIPECIEVILEITNKYPVTIFIDALDECDSTKRHILFQLLEEITSKSANLVKFLVSSRDDLDIVLRFRDMPNKYIEATDNEEDIKRFVELELDKSIKDRRLLGGMVSPELKLYIQHNLLEKTRGMFRWVSLQLQHLCNSRRIKIEEDVRQELGRLPSTLEESYDVIFSQIRESGVASYQVAMKSFQWLLFGHQSFSTTEFLKAVSPDDSCKKLAVYDILNICCNLLVMDSKMNTFRFCHLSVREYLEKQHEFVYTNGNSILAGNCVEICLSNLYDVGTELDFWPENSLLRYAALYWPIHLRESSCVNSALEEQIQRRLLLTLSGRVFNKWISLVSSFPRGSISKKQSWRDMLLESLSHLPNPLFFVAAFGFADSAMKLLKVKDIDLEVENQFGHTPLQIACHYGNDSIARMFLDKGIKNNRCLSPVHMHRMYPSFYADPLAAAAALQKPQLIEALVKSGIDIGQSGALAVAARKGDVPMIHFLLSQGAYIDESGPYGVALNEAAAANHFEICQLLLDAGAKVDVCSTIRGHEYPLIAASSGGHDRIVKLLLDHNANINIMSEWEGTPLGAALSEGQTTTTKLLLNEGASLKEKKSFFSCFFSALIAESGVLENVKSLIAAGADINTSGGFFGTVLNMAIFYRRYDAVKYLVASGADIMRKGCGNRNSVEYLMGIGSFDCVKFIFEKFRTISPPGKYRRTVKRLLQCRLLHNGLYGGSSIEFLPWALKQGCHIDDIDKDGTTYLHSALYSGDYATARIFLGKNANCKGSCERYGNTIQALMLGGSIYRVFGEEEEHLRLLKDLIARGVDINDEGGPLGNCLTAACSEGLEKCVQELLDQGAKIRSGSDREGGPLQVAAAKGCSRIVQILLKAGADVNEISGQFHCAILAAACKGWEIPDNHINTPQKYELKHYVRTNGHEEIFQILLDAGSDISITGGVFGNVLQGAAYSGNEQVVQDLLFRQFDVNTRGGLFGSALQAAACGGSCKVVSNNPESWKKSREEIPLYQPQPPPKENTSANILRLLLDAGAEVNYIGGIFGTALQAAAYSGDIVLVNLLLENGATVAGPVCGHYGDPIQASISQDEWNYRYFLILSRLLEAVPQSQLSTVLANSLEKARNAKNKIGIKMLRSAERDFIHYT